MNKFLILIIILVGLLSGWYLLADGDQPISKVIVKDKEFKVLLADTLSEQVVGLSGRESLAADQGMLFIFPDKSEHNFWMKSMKFNIDLLWLSDNIIIGWEENMEAPAVNAADSQLLRYQSPAGTNRVLELPAGTIKRLDLSIGDRVNYE